MDAIILHHMSQPVYFDTPSALDMTLLVIFFSKVFHTMQCYFVSPSNHFRKFYNTQCYKEIVIFMLGCFAFFSDGGWGDTFFCPFQGIITLLNFLGQACMALKLWGGIMKNTDD